MGSTEETLEDERPDDDLEPTEVSPRKEQLGRYVLHAVLGRGGMASVHLGRMVAERGFERWVAIKRMHEHLIGRQQTRKMFLDEARTAARLQHPNVIQVTDFGEETGSPYLVMEYVHGETLSAILRRCRQLGTPLSAPLAARIVAWACEGLHHAHELVDSAGEPMSLVHRDVSPQNVMVSYDGVVKVTDFGIAKVVGRLQDTGSGQTKGKTAYMSPEQVLAQRLDRRSDVFSMGVVLFESSLGVRLFKAETELETLHRIIGAVVPPPRSIDPRYPAALEKVLRKALACKPDDRYATAREMQRDLEAYLVGTGKTVGTAEVAELMGALFAQRRLSREAAMRAAECADVTIDIDVELSPASLSLGPGVTEVRRGRSRLRWILPSLALVVVAIVGLVTWRSLASRPAAPGAAVGDAALAAPLAAGRSAGRPAGDEPRAAPADRPAGAGPGSSDGSPGAARSAADGGATAEPAAAPGDRDSSTDAESPGAASSGELRLPPRERPAVGSVSVIARPWCDVYLGGRKLGRTPILAAEVPAGRRTLEFRPLGKGPGRRRAVVVAPGASTPVSLDFTEDASSP